MESSVLYTTGDMELLQGIGVIPRAALSQYSLGSMEGDNYLVKSIPRVPPYELVQVVNDNTWQEQNDEERFQLPGDATH